MDSTIALTLYVGAGLTVDLGAVGVPDTTLTGLERGATPPDGAGPGVWLVAASELGADVEAISQRLVELRLAQDLEVVLSAELEETGLTPQADELVFSFINPHAPAHLSAKVLRRALTTVRLQCQQRLMAESLLVRDRQLNELNSIGVALSAERDVDSLLGLILSQSRDITGADGGSLYLIEPAEDGGRQLRFKLSQNASFDLPYAEFTMPLNTKSLAGYTGVTGEVLRLDDVYQLPSGVEYGFSRSFDEQTGYRTKSMLVVPMRNNQGEIRGVLQLINRKPSGALKLTTRESFEATVISFDEQCEELVSSLASQAAVALENQLLLQNISEIFEGFLAGWIKAVEDRDPATGGHSVRVTALTLGLAREVNRATTGPYAAVRFDEHQMKELRYAGLLHDIGKIYVRAEVFLKAKKLYNHHLKMIEERFDFVRRTLEAEFNRKKLELMVDDPQGNHIRRFEALDREHRQQLEVLDDYFQTILMANEPAVMDDDRFGRLTDVAAATYKDIYGNSRHLLQPEEVRLLNIRRGNLDEAERKEIESHVMWSYQILSRIPWSAELANIPEIAGGHHEKLDGSGYPWGWKADRIPVQSKMMTIADIYDALTAADRPYKRAQPVERAMRILHFEVDDGHIDPELMRLFEEREVWRLAHMDNVEELVDRLVYEDVL